MALEERHHRREYAIGVVAAACALLVRWPIHHLLGTGVPYITFFPAVVIASLIGGLRSGLTAAIGGALFAWFMVMPPHFAVPVDSTAFYVGLLVYLASSATIASVGGGVLAARDRARRAEDVARREKEKLRVTVASIGDGLIATGPDGRVAFMNEVAERLTGWTSRDAEGRPLEEVLRIVNEATREPVANPAQRALRHGRIVGLANHTVLIARDGTERPIDDSAAPIVDGSGALDGCVLVFRDVSQRRASEQALRQSEERFRMLADNMAQLAWIADADGALGWYNRRWFEYTGSTLDEMRGWGWQAVVHPEHLARVLATVRDCLARGVVWEDTVPIRAADGSYGWFLSRAIPIHDRDGRVLCWFGTATDVTRQRDAENALRAADQRKDEFLATLAHELRNPLAPIRSSIEIMKHASGDPRLVDPALATMERQVTHLVRLVDDLLDISRISRDKLELKIARVTLADVLEPAVEACRPLADEARHQLEVRLPGETVWLDGDLVRLTQVFSNLLDNACKYTPPGGRIAVEARRTGDEVQVAVRDSGVGIAPKMAQHIFDLFAQAGHSSDQTRGGLGIGLSLVRRLVEMHGGHVEASSAGPGHGSEFVVRLPVAASAPAADVAAARTPPAAGVPARRATRRILVVDDNLDAAESLGLLLELGGHETRLAHDGLEAVAVAEEFRPDVVLLDIGLPRLSGSEAARRIRATAWGKDILLIALTGWGQEDDRRSSKEAGFDHHLVKPVDHESLLRLLDRHGAGRDAAGPA